MTRKERIFATLRQQGTDRVPAHFDLTTWVARKLAEHYGAEETQVEDRIGNHLAKLRPAPPAGFEAEDLGNDLYRDEFGAVWRRGESTLETGNWGGHLGWPLGEPSLGAHRYPDPCAPGRLAHLAEFVQEHRDDFVVLYLNGIFDRAWHVRGFANFMADLAAHPKFAQRLLDLALGFNLGLVEQIPAGGGVDGILDVEDWGAQEAMLISPLHWRRLLKPRLAQLFAAARGKGLAVFVHSCGHISEIVSDLVEIGVGVLNPVQPEAMDVEWVKREFGRDLVLWGGIGAQSVIPYGSPEQVRQAASHALRTLGSAGGYIFGNAGAVPTETPLENMLALIEMVST